MSDLRPNTFQTPNEYVDKYLYLLTSDECKVLLYAVRRIFGFNKDQDRIAVSQFADGLVSTKICRRRVQIERQPYSHILSDPELLCR